ncbi:HAMP domain-containing histidine kinase [Chloroflexi bacterium CFX6]|nr:HAMP domain-containing histidine kinase [Chloroflexi bacterium CFX6]
MKNNAPRTHSLPRHRSGRRFGLFALFFFAVFLCFVGGASASLFELFTQNSAARQSWLLLCGAPVGVVIVLFIIIINLYMRFGKPLQSMFNAIDSVAEGNLSARVPENKSDMFSELFKRFNKMVVELERAEKQRRNLTADIAHELRTPLHIIQGNLEGVLDGVYQPTPEHINNTLDETRLLTRLVNDLQTLSLAETGQLPLHPTRFLLADLINDLTSSFSAQAASLGIDLKTSLADPNQQLTADYDRLNQVLSNLISNALRHTPSGGVVSIQTEPIHNSANHQLRITITDTGSGIPAEDLPFIFDRFWRGDRSRSERTHSGLGLAIAKQLIHAHGGTIDVKSETGKGTTFIIEL